MYSGKLVRLREYRSEDIPLAKEYINSTEVRQYIEGNVPFLYTLHNEQQWYESLSPQEKTYTFAIEALESKEYIGGCGINEINYKNSIATVGIFIGNPEYLSKGYGTDAMKVLVKFIFEQMNINKIKLHVYDFNLRAQKSYEKVGFKREAVLKDELFRNGRYHDIIQLSMFKKDYFEQNSLEV